MFTMFVVRELFIHERTHHNQTGTKPKGRRRGASPSVQFMSHMDGSRSDLPPLFNQKLFKMRESMDGCAQCQQQPLTAEKIIKDIVSWKDPNRMREDLRFMWDMFVILNEHSTAEERSDVYVTYTALYDALGDIQTLKSMEG